MAADIEATEAMAIARTTRPVAGHIDDMKAIVVIEVNGGMQTRIMVEIITHHPPMIVDLPWRNASNVSLALPTQATTK